MGYRGAFNCEKCPKSNDENAERSCPVWWETIFTNKEGETKIEKSCAWVQLPQFLIEVIKAGNRPAAEMAKITNVLQSGFDGVRKQIGAKFNQFQPFTPTEQYQRPANPSGALSHYNSVESVDDPSLTGD